MAEKSASWFPEALKTLGIPIATVVVSIAMSQGGAAAKQTEDHDSIRRLWDTNRTLREDVAQQRIQSAGTLQWRADRERWEARIEDKIDRLIDRQH